jgi:sugar (pentulose or hexulose) kinase
VAEEVLIGVDIGASSIRAGGFQPDGRQLALAVRVNAPTAQPGGEGWFMWDAPKLRASCEQVLREVTDSLDDPAAVKSVAVTGFGADGAPFSSGGEQRYPIISWHDARAREQVERLVRALGAEAIYATTGYHPYPINTIARWLWLRERAADSLEDATWLMVPDIAGYWLSGEMRTDPTIASTTMAFDLRADDWAAGLFEAAQIPPELPAERAEPGEAIGTIGGAAAEATGLPVGAIVGAAGHDCEVGTLAASGHLPDGTFIDITGTWEMLIVLTPEFTPSEILFEHGIDWERHTSAGSYLCQSLMPAGSVLAWLRDLAYPDSGDAWARMVGDAELAEPGAGGVTLVPAFVPGMGPFGRTGKTGALLGLQTTTKRAQLARAAYESLCYQLRAQLEVLERATGSGCRTLRVLGGGQRNDFWLQLKADVTGRAVEAVQTAELTLLGAALLGGVATGVYATQAEAQQAVSHRVRVFEPDTGRQARYEELFNQNYLGAAR